MFIFTMLKCLAKPYPEKNNNNKKLYPSNDKHVFFSLFRFSVAPGDVLHNHTIPSLNKRKCLFYCLF